jgi:hypothetical protein
MIDGEGLNRNVSHPILVIEGITHSPILPFGCRKNQRSKVLRWGAVQPRRRPKRGFFSISYGNSGIEGSCNPTQLVVFIIQQEGVE